MAPKGPRKNKFRYLSVLDGVVPSGEVLVLGDFQLLHLGIGNFNALGVDLAQLFCTNAQTGGSGGRTDVVEDSFKAVERLSSPVLADFAEQSMFNRIPL